jgi:hypothetical protein
MAQAVLQSAAMARFRPGFGTFLSWLLVAATIASGCEKTCAIAACSGWPVTGWLNLPTETPAGAEVVACHDDVCARAPLPTNPGPLLFDRTDVAGDLETYGNGSRRVVVGWFVGKDGDRFSVVVNDAAGGQLASIEATPDFPPPTATDGCPTLCQSVAFGDVP